MFRTRLQAVVLAIIGFVSAVPAYADAQVENAVRLWTGDLRKGYDQTIDLISNGKINAAKEPVAKLHELTQNMQEATFTIQESANVLASELGAAWTDTLKAMDQLNAAVAGLKAQIGTTRPNVDPLRSALSTADEALKKSLEFTRAFGKRYGEIMGGPVENAKELFDGYLTEGYEKTLEYLEQYNTDSGKPEIDRLREIAARLYETTGTASSNAASLARPLQDGWRPVHEAASAFIEAVEEVQDVVGESDYDLDDMKGAYASLSSAMAASYNGFLEFGERLRAITDNWG